MKCGLIPGSIYFFYNLPLKRHQPPDGAHRGLINLFCIFVLREAIRIFLLYRVEERIVAACPGLFNTFLEIVREAVLMSTVLLAGLRSLRIGEFREKWSIDGLKDFRFSRLSICSV